MESFFTQRAFQNAPAADAPAAGGPSGFHSLFTVLGNPGPTVASSEKTTVPEAHVPGSLPKIELVQDAEGRVTKIVVTCRCCERIELDCTY